MLGGGLKCYMTSKLKADNGPTSSDSCFLQYNKQVGHFRLWSLGSSTVGTWLYDITTQKTTPYIFYPVENLKTQHYG